jgi:outer membrane protein assembly factor BamB
MPRSFAVVSLAVALVLAGAAVVPALAAPAADSSKPFTGTGGTIKAAPGEWPQFRGPNRDGLSAETGMLRQWPKDGPPLLWKMDKLGRGLAGIAIAGGRMYTMGDRGRNTSVQCYTVADQKEVWATEVGEGMTDGPRCTPTVDGNRVYVITEASVLACLNTADGKIVWQRHLKRDFGGRVQGSYNFCESPLVDGDKLIVTPGANDATIVALNKETGAVIWKAQTPGFSDWGVGYSSLVVSEACGIRQCVTLLGHGLVGVAAKDGKFLWGYQRIANSHTSIPTPIIRGDYVYAVNGYGAGACVVKLNPDGEGGIKAKEVWFLTSDKFQSTCGQSVIVGDYIYSGHGDRDGVPICVKFDTSEIMWKQDKEPPGHGVAHIIAVDGLLIMRYIEHDVVLLEATPKGYNLLGHFKVDPQKGAGLAPIHVSDGKLFIRINEFLYCYDIKKH